MIKDAFKAVLAAALVVGLLFGLAFLGYEMDVYFWPKQEALRNEVFHNSAAYNDGMIRDLSELEEQYVQADVAGKDALRAVTLQRFAAYPLDRMTIHQQNFYQQLKGNK